MKIKSETFMKKYGTLVHVYSTEISVFHTLRFNSIYMQYSSYSALVGKFHRYRA